MKDVNDYRGRIITSIAEELGLADAVVNSVVNLYFAKTKKRISTRQQIQQDLLQKFREDAIKCSLEVKMLERIIESSYLPRADAPHVQDKLDQVRIMEKEAITRLEVMKELRDFNRLDTRENRDLVSKLPNIYAVAGDLDDEIE